MPDNVIFQTSVTATPPNATTVATDDISGAHHQFVKIEFGDNGTAYAVSYGTPLPIGTIPGGTFSIAGTLQVLGSVSIVGTLSGGTVGVIGTIQGLGTFQPLAGSVHLASRLPGTADIGTIAGTVSVLGTIQPLAGSVHLATNLAGGTIVAVGSAVHGAAADTRPLLLAAFGSSGTQAAVDDGDATRLWSDLNGRLQVRGTIDSLPAISGTVQAHGTIPVGTVAGTVSVLGTVQPLAGSAHLASRLPGTADIGTVAGTVSVLGTVQPLAGSVHLASRLPGTVDIGTIAGTVSIGTIAGTASILGTVSLIGGNGSVGAFAQDQAAFVAGVPSVGPIAGVSTAILIGQGSIGALAMTLRRALYATLRTPNDDSAMDETNDAVRVNIVAGSGAGVTHTDDAAFTVAVDDGVPVFGFFNDVTPDSVNEGDAGAVRMSANRNLYVTLRDAAGNERGLNVDASGRITVLGAGTFEALGTVQPLAGSVHLASRLPGTADIGTVAGTVSILGTVQGLAGSVHLATNLAGGTVVSVGSAAHGAAADTRPLLISAFGSSGTQAAVDDGDAVRLWSDLNGRLQVRGTIDSLPVVSGTVQVHGTVPVGTVAGTVSVLGTVQPLAGSVHLATNLAGGTIVAVGSAVHGAAADTRPLLISAFGSSGTQVAVDDGDAVRLWADLNGRLQVRGTIDSIPNITITAGTVGLAGGTQHIGSVQRVAGTVDVGTIAGTVSIGTVGRLVGTITGGTMTVQAGGFGTYFGSVFTAAVSFGTLIPPPATGTKWRLFDVTLSASASGTVLFTEAATGAAGTTVWGPMFFAGSGGWQFNSSRGLLARVAAQGLYFSNSAGSMSVTVNYGLEG